ncbi:MAG: homogentisate 1,2-dioxygenase [Sphingomonadales bacterium]|nr:homogentisate 1,2-dioxygenase [Sphingomonadaceae bacterium]MBS3932545.1 homogentisate 1,2-dioxygenase [Sphingomonadales bacterium]
MKPSWIHVVKGRTARQARVGTIGTFHEELFGRAGFVGPTAMLYHGASPSELLRVEGDTRVRVGTVTQLATSDLDDARGDFEPLLVNSDLKIGISRRCVPMPYCYRNAVGDLLYFVHRGTGVFATEFGPIDYEPGDYILLPRGTTFRHLPADAEGIFYVVESRLPVRFTEHAQIGRHAPFDPAIITIPDVKDYGWPAQDEWELRVKHSAGHTSLFLSNCPIDLVGWKGDLFPFKINIRDIIPIMSDRIHLAPTAWCTFETDTALIVTFLPQTAVTDLTAEELPSNHRNIDCDEAVFIHADKMRPDGILLHLPQAIMHGSKQGDRDAFQATRTTSMRRELTGVSVDAFEPLQPTDAFRNIAGG